VFDALNTTQVVILIQCFLSGHYCYDYVMNEANYLKWLIADTVRKYPDLKWFMGCVSDTLNKLTVEDIRYYYVNDLHRSGSTNVQRLSK